MSTPDQPDTPPLTRRQMREIRNTGSTPIIVPADEEPVVEPEPEPQAPAAPTPAPLARAAEPAPIAPAPDADVDLGVTPLTRRQARQQERIRTASIPVVTPDLAPAPEAKPTVISEVPQSAESADDGAHQDDDALDAPGDIAGAPAEAPATAEPEALAATIDDEADADADGEPDSTDDVVSTPAEEHVAGDQDDDDQDGDDSPVEAVFAPADDEPETPARIVHPALGSDLLQGEVPIATLPPSFDQLIARNASATGSVATSNALILSQTPAGSPLVAPVTATGEVLITGTFELPEGLGSVGHAPGAADGKDLDVALIDGELPAASSPTPIAASAAISTARNSGEEIIRPPAPEKGGRLMLALIITAGVLALAVGAALVLLLTTGRI